MHRRQWSFYIYGAIIDFSEIKRKWAYQVRGPLWHNDIWFKSTRAAIAIDSLQIRLVLLGEKGLNPNALVAPQFNYNQLLSFLSLVTERCLWYRQFLVLIRKVGEKQSRRLRAKRKWCHLFSQSWSLHLFFYSFPSLHLVLLLFL